VAPAAEHAPSPPVCAAAAEPEPDVPPAAYLAQWAGMTEEMDYDGLLPWHDTYDLEADDAELFSREPPPWRAQDPMTEYVVAQPGFIDSDAALGAENVLADTQWAAATDMAPLLQLQ
jgi:hypothetical protein